MKRCFKECRRVYFRKKLESEHFLTTQQHHVISLLVFECYLNRMRMCLISFIYLASYRLIQFLQFLNKMMCLLSKIYLILTNTYVLVQQHLE